MQVFILENIKNLLTVHNVLTDHLSFEVLYRSSLTEASFSRLVYTMFTLTLRLLSSSLSRLSLSRFVVAFVLDLKSAGKNWVTSS